jgi:MFS family permease
VKSTPQRNAVNAAAVTGTDPYVRAAYRYYALALLTTAYVLNFLDRQILAILQEPIKRELQLSDSQLGLLTGFSFALFYVLLGLPIARWADRGIRRNIVALAVGTWSAMTTLCGLAQNYAQLLLARVGVGVGEAGGSPPAYSMISDMFPQRDRATAYGVYGMGVNLGILGGLLIGGWVNQYFGWRVAFLAAGIPGVLLALILRTTLREPLRRSAQPTAAQERPPVADVLRILWARHTFRHMVWGTSLLSFAAYGMFNWLPPFLMRSHGLTSGAIGTWLALILGVGGALATLAGGYLSDRLGRRDARWYSWVTTIAYALAVPSMICAFLVSDTTLALLCLVIPGSVAQICVPPLMAVTHNLVDNRMRALSSAIVLFILNVLGLGLGPLSVGILSDALRDSAGSDSLRQALLILVPAATMWGAGHFLFAARHLRRDLEGSTRA